MTQAMKLQSFETGPIDLTEGIKQYKKMAEEFSTEQIIRFLANAVNIPEYDEAEKFAIELSKEFVFRNDAYVRLYDEYGNTVGVLKTDEDKIAYDIMQYYDCNCAIQAQLISVFILTAVEKKKLRSNDILDYLRENSWYNYNLITTFPGNTKYSMKWINFIEQALNIYFVRLEYYIKTKDTKALFFIPEIDSLTLKFEGIIRDLYQMSAIENFSVYNFKREFGIEIVEYKNINNLLWDKNIFKILQKDDVWFLRYLLIEQKNLRNNVAHSKMLMEDYNFDTMNLLLIAILRLSRFKLKKTT